MRHPYALPFLLFSLVSAFCLLTGFALADAANGTLPCCFGLSDGRRRCGERICLLDARFPHQGRGNAGVHVWLPGAYAEADDDLSAMLSSVVSKVAIFGLFVVTYLAIRSEAGLELAHLMGWIGMLTTVAGAVMALQQDDIKRMLAYSSMSSARLHCDRNRPDEPSRLGDRVLPRRQPPDGQGHPVHCRRRHHPPHRHAQHGEHTAGWRRECHSLSPLSSLRSFRCPACRRSRALAANGFCSAR